MRTTYVKHKPFKFGDTQMAVTSRVNQTYLDLEKEVEEKELYENINRIIQHEKDLGTW